MATATLCVVALAGTAGCGSRNDPADAGPRMTPVADASSASPSPSPSPSPTPEPTPVHAERLSRSVDVGDGALLGPDDRAEVDEAAVGAFADAIFTWLDAHLGDLQSGGHGHLADVLPEGLDIDDPAVVPALTTALASPDRPVGSASYELTAYHDAGPQFATVTVGLADADGTARTATLVFAPAADGHPVLVLGETEVTR